MGLVAPVIYLSYKTVGFSDSPGHSSESRRCGGELVSGFGWSWLLGVAMFPGVHLQSNPWHAAFVEGRTAQEKNVLEITCSGEMQYAITADFLLGTACEQRWSLN